MKRVLHIFGKMDVGGAETLFMNIYREIDKNLVQFDFLVHSTSPGYYDSEIKKLGGRIFYIKPPSEIGFLKFKKNFIDILNDVKPNIVHSHVHLFSGWILKIAAQRGVEIRISHSHTGGHNNHNGLKRNVYEFAMKHLIQKYATNMLGCSKLAVKELFGQNSTAKVFNNSVNLELYSNSNGKSGVLKSELKINDKSKLVGHIGRFELEKNHEFLISVFREALQLKQELHLILIGEGSLKESIMQGILNDKKLKSRVHFLNVRRDIPKILKELDLVLFPSKYEGLGNVAIESQAAGTPIICSTNVPNEVDLGLKLVNFLSLDNEGSWIGQIEKELNTVYEIPFSIIEEKFKIANYEIKTSIENLYEIYRVN